MTDTAPENVTEAPEAAAPTLTSSEAYFAAIAAQASHRAAAAASVDAIRDAARARRTNG
ncbi:hypothetical protein P3H15_52160 [Rhodococcus sp. T2V]|uniref:hypothetical protein n=1 Tax=Rhodococcus sp. T2V TaxID=3034164 RepID=UPI0023E1EDD6|nr:hypothetical protein [Rhodococcus sp. T2V]MDF3313461.1 hypothetical protein [Rhodococcus sp. T2V]